ncbi:MAG: asparagine synthase-related protein [Aulosira sp. ZfuVER01]|nr:asparagine synthase-related protein [Aulosira sp. ZfuVER01]MDZ7998058.1 asparagine synthase-related protein [Aulosira sp. DedVER01a]MDZ8050452.1 asparagine synthase-related protein [Aulosira sp. ZfuCHP01]
MSKVVLVCRRDKKNKYTQADIERLSNRLMPDNFSPNPPKTICQDGVLIGIFNPNKTVGTYNTSVYLGQIITEQEHWWQPKTCIADGSFALFRSDDNFVELVTDVLASRTIWYVKTEQEFIASTSQRAIVFFLKSFQPNKTTVSWMLSSGSLGFGLSWDTRIKSVEADSSVLLNRSSWELEIKKKDVVFQSQNLSKKQHKKQLLNSLENTFTKYDFDYSNWILPLSGGFDSRAILLLLKNRTGLKTVTWGLKSSLSEPNSDAYVANKLATHIGVENKYFELDSSSESWENIFQRFLVAGEGRIDHISGYMDGFKVWKELFEQGVLGIIRGDEAFGFPILSAFTSLDVRRVMNNNLLSDYYNYNIIAKFGFESQIFPERLLRKNRESFADWRDRLYHEFRIPYILAALTDLKCSYVEIINPLLSREIIEQVRQMPSYLRIQKKLFKSIIISLSPKGIPFAQQMSTQKLEDLLATQEYVNFLSRKLKTDSARKILTSEFIDYIFENLQVSNSKPAKNSWKSKIRMMMPEELKCYIKTLFPAKSLPININRLALRALIICEMNQILVEDAMQLEMSKLNLNPTK